MEADAASIVDIGSLARWSTSSHKYGFSLDNLRDGDDETFWQSEGPQPHSIDLAFPRKVLISSVDIHLSHPLDDSYTPAIISLQVGTSIHDLQEARHLELEKPNGWLHFPLRPITNVEEQPAEEECGEPKRVEKTVDGPPLLAYYLRVVIVANHQNGKDTHVRGLKVSGVASAPTQITSLDIAAKTASPAKASKQTFNQKPSKGKQAQDSESASEDEFGIKKIPPQYRRGIEALECGNDASSGFSSIEYRQFERIR